MRHVPDDMLYIRAMTSLIVFRHPHQVKRTAVIFDVRRALMPEILPFFECFFPVHILLHRNGLFLHKRG